MVSIENKYYLRPNCLLDPNIGKFLYKNNEAIKVDDIFFSHIEVFNRTNKKVKRVNYSFRDFSKLIKRNVHLDNLFGKLYKCKNVNKNNIFKKKKYLIFGILNLTPDSFSDGGEFIDISKSINQAKHMHKNGANYIDVGGESTRPGATKVSDNDEILRVLPCLQKLNSLGIPVSLDTRNSSTMEFGALSGVQIINDVSGLENDIQSVEIIKKYKKNIIIMHMPGNPTNMMKKINIIMLF